MRINIRKPFLAYYLIIFVIGVFFLHKSAGLTMATWVETSPTIDCTNDPFICPGETYMLPNTCCNINATGNYSTNTNGPYICNWVKVYKCDFKTDSTIEKVCWEDQYYTYKNHTQCPYGCSGNACNPAPTPIPGATATPTPTPGATPPTTDPTCTFNRNYNQCGGTCNGTTYPSTNTVSVDEYTNPANGSVCKYACSDLGAICGQCGNTCTTPAKYRCSGTSCIRDDTSGTFDTSNCNNTCTPPEGDACMECKAYSTSGCQDTFWVKVWSNAANPINLNDPEDRKKACTGVVNEGKDGQGCWITTNCSAPYCYTQATAQHACQCEADAKYLSSQGTPTYFSYTANPYPINDPHCYDPAPACTVTWNNNVPLPKMAKNTTATATVSETSSNIGWSYVSVYDGATRIGPSSCSGAGGDCTVSIPAGSSDAIHQLTFQVNDYAVYGQPVGSNPNFICTPSTSFETITPYCKVIWDYPHTLPANLLINTNYLVNITQSDSNVGWDYVATYLGTNIQNTVLASPPPPPHYQATIRSSTPGSKTLYFKINDPNAGATPSPFPYNQTTVCNPVGITFSTPSPLPTTNAWIQTTGGDVHSNTGITIH